MKLAHILVLPAVSFSAQFAHSADAAEPAAPRAAAPTADLNSLMAYTLLKEATPDLVRAAGKSTLVEAVRIASGVIGG